MIFNTFKDTIFLKESSSLNKKLKALEQLYEEHPNNYNIKNELFMVKKGIQGEKEIRYRLSKANIGMYVLHDINLEYKNLKTQIDFIVVTRYCCYFIECKNLYGNITIDENGSFLREFNYNGKKVKKGIDSPLTQVETQRDVYKKIWSNTLSSNKFINLIRRTINESNFSNIHRVLVCAANSETIINDKYAPQDIKNKIVRADGLIRKIESDLKTSDKSMHTSKKSAEAWAKYFLSLNVEDKTDYYNYYKNVLIDNDNRNDSSELREKLIVFRKERSRKKNMPAYYIFNNKELNKLIEVLPKTIDELKPILSDIKIKNHGKEIIKVINNYSML